MKIAIHANQIEWQQRYARHTVEGLRRHGIRTFVTSSTTRQLCDIAILMGPNAWQNIERVGKPYLMFNRKFVGNDPRVVHENCAIGWNGFNGYGTFCVDEVDPSRLKNYITEEEFLPWHKGKNIIYCEQSNVGRAEEFKTLQQYYNYVKKYAGNVVFRRKPIGEENISYEGVKNSLLKQNPKVLVNLNSTLSLDCLIAGIPVISLDKGDPVYAITGHDINQEPNYPDRLPLFQYLAHCQWTESEIKSGKFWDHIYPKRGIKLHEVKYL